MKYARYQTGPTNSLDLPHTSIRLLAIITHHIVSLVKDNVHPSLTAVFRVGIRYISIK